MDTKVQLDETLDYKIKAKRQSYYRFQKVVQNTGAESVTIGAAQQVSTFEIPAVPLSLARSHLNFETSSAAQGGGAYAHLFRNTVPWSRVELFTRSGVYLMDITNFAEMFLSVAQRTKNIEEFHTSDFDVLSRTAINDVSTKKYASSGDNLANTVSWRVAFRELYDTVLSVDKSIHFNEVLNLRITWREAQAHAIKVTMPTLPLELLPILLEILPFLILLYTSQLRVILMWLLLLRVLLLLEICLLFLCLMLSFTKPILIIKPVMLLVLVSVVVTAECLREFIHDFKIMMKLRTTDTLPYFLVLKSLHSILY
jgi:hypothetical protein